MSKPATPSAPSPPSTPLMRQYSGIKQRYPETLLFFRLGDFYELFYEDAVTAARELEITLTSRNKEKGVPIPMCGVPHHAAQGYVNKLIRKGYRVAICDQVEDAKLTKQLVKREVTRVVTPGTSVDADIASAREHNYLGAVARKGDSAALALADLSTGDFRVAEFSGPEAHADLDDELERMRPREVLLPRGQEIHSRADGDAANGDLAPGYRVPVPTYLDEWVFEPDYSARILREQLGVTDLRGLGLDDRPLALAAAGAIVHYVGETQRAALSPLDHLKFYHQQDYLLLDPVTLRNLELLEPMFGNPAETTLSGSLDQCATSMGSRLLRHSILHPSLDRSELIARLDAVEEFTGSTIGREKIRETLARVQDLERLLSKVALGTAHGRDMLGLMSSFKLLPEIRRLAEPLGAARLAELRQSIDPLEDLHQLLEKSIHPEAPAQLTEGRFIRPGYHAPLDELRELSRNSRQHIAAIEDRERKRTGIGSLKVRFNNVFGYYIEVSKANLHLAPDDYERKQTLVNAERFTTPELKDYEAKVLDAEEKIRTLEQELFVEIRNRVAGHAPRIRLTAQALAQLDLLACFAYLAATRDYHRPEFSGDEEDELILAEARHPIVERLEETERGGKFTPNDLYMNSGSDRILLVTGPNMGGKSTYLRQTALIALMAQMGSFVPAGKAVLPIFDRIFTRIGASDNLARGRSTFMVEMTETAGIVNTATRRSLILLDEVGRGTATFDGLSLAWAVVEHLLTDIGAKTLFATHYHELTELGELLPGIRNYHATVKETESGILFLRKVVAGSADKSYGIDVARLAGLPPAVIERAREILARHEQSEHSLSEHLASSSEKGEGKRGGPVQLTIFTPLNHEIIKALEEADLDNLKPLDALNLLAQLKKQIGS